MLIKQERLFVMLAFGLVGVILLSGCVQQPPSEEASVPQVNEMKSETAWMNLELADVATGQKFKISDFKGKPILLESFAVWCPTCLKQQEMIREVNLREGDAIIHISLDTDPNEDEARVREHIETHGFDWYFAISPIELTNALIDEFGLTIVNAPSAPVLLICEDQSTRFLRGGVKSADELLLEIGEGC